MGRKPKPSNAFVFRPVFDAFPLLERGAGSIGYDLPYQEVLPMSVKKKRNAKGTPSVRQRISLMKNGKPYTYWEARITTGYDPVTGKQKQRSITGHTQSEVREKATALQCQLDMGNYIEPSKITLSAWLDCWLRDYVGNLKDSTAYLYQHEVALHITPYIGNIKLCKLNTEDIQHLYNTLQNPQDEGVHPLSPKSIVNVHTTLRKALKQAVALKYIASNPADNCVLPRREKKSIAYALNPNEIKAFFTAIRGNRYECYYTIALFTGLRDGEIRGLTWDAIDFDNRTMKVKQQLRKNQARGGEYCFSDTKNGEEREIALSQHLVDVLHRQREEQERAHKLFGDEWSNPHHLVCTNWRGGYLSHNTVYSEYRRILKKAGLPDIRLHDLRHTYATVALQNGDDPKTVQENLGHATSDFTMRVYAHTTMAAKRRSADNMDKFIDAMENIRTEE